MEVSGQLHASPTLPQGKSPWFPLDRKMGGPQSRSGRGGEEKNTQPSSGIKLWNPDRPAVAQRYTDWAIKKTEKSNVKIHLGPRSSCSVS
jgi:hypothetical protein